MSNPEANRKEIQFQVIGPSDIDEIYAFAERRSLQAIPDETARTFFSWSAKWRREALEHYLKLGWSFVARLEGETVGFFLAQPFMFFRGQTQTVWVEHIESTDEHVRRALMEIVVRVGREKHMQRVLFAEAQLGDLAVWNGRAAEDVLFEVKTTKG